ncbi:hypothetical protein RSO01_86940 [Reyranella soli]|uniref:Uncharacterized protein n=1 Tax=Reyranella soli TaxID=1230389 RepID=A0A512NRE4_9HYPH|nr:hypothetical protein RSO01_86940 [Reyranella soli]
MGGSDGNPLGLKAIMAAVKIATEFRYLLRDRDRRGNPRVHYRPPVGKMIRLRATIGTQAFVDEYRRAEGGVPPCLLQVR